MTNKNYQHIFYIIVLALSLVAFIVSCDTGVQSSPKPGILRIVLQSNPTDTSIIIINDTLTVSDGDNFRTTVFQGKAYSDSVFAILYPSINSYRQEDKVINVIERENNTYKPHIIFESYVPPGNYTSIVFGLTADLLHIGIFDIPVELPPNESKLVALPVNFEVAENKTTEIKVQLNPFKSVQRFRDSYYFNRQLEVVEVKYF
ncbi:hypothetical protein ABRY23_09620 [Melioribacteraceae bacterium 4301-Me]|uniref:hypothetical protein n=1 Tax=Pyranulibacter aquaticus TaxID=3163344 RepID=UPI003596B4C1